MVRKHNYAAAWRPDLDLDERGRVHLARLLAETASRAAGSTPLPSMRPLLAALSGLAASAAGDGPVQMPAGDLSDAQRSVLRKVLDSSARRARGDADPAAGSLTSLARQWGQKIGYRGEPVPVGREW